jgi:hypothetical protein
MNAQTTDLKLAEKTNTDVMRSNQEQCSVGYSNNASFSLLWRVGTMFSKSQLVPEAFRGEQNIPSCCIAVNMASRLGADPLLVMQNLYIVYGRPAWSGKFKIATLNQSGQFSKIKFEWKGKTKNADDPEWGCRAYCSERETGEILYGPWVDMRLVRAEGWYDKKDRNGNFCSKWRTMPELMFMYRAGSQFVDTHCPEISMGIRTTEELDDIETAKNITADGETIDRVPNMPPSPNVPVNPANFEAGTVSAQEPAKPTTNTQAPPAKQASKPKANKQPEVTTQAGVTYSDKEPEPAGIGVTAADLFGGENPNFGD